jgi:hypothetical protein
MYKFSKLFMSSLLLLSVPIAVRSASAETQGANSKAPVQTVVTVLGPNFTAPPALGKSDVIVHTGNRREDVLAWDAAQGDKSALELAILIDDGTNIGNQLDDLRKFIRAQSKDTSVGVFYASNGITEAVAPFSTDHDAVAKKLRITVGFSGTSTSIYFALMDTMSKWHATGARREILLIADGIDRYRGDPNSSDVT